MSLQARRSKGMTLLELAVVVGIILVVSLIAVPNIVSFLNSYRLETSGRATASFLQQARLQAVRNNVPAYVQFDNTKTPNIAYVNSDPATAYVLGNPDIELSSATFQTNNLPDHGQLDTLITNNNSGVTAEIGTVIGFNARGLPCIEGANVYLCTQQDPTAPNKVPYFEWFISGPNGGWEAVTVSPAGRIKAWRMTAPTGCGQGNGSACWQ